MSESLEKNLAESVHLSDADRSLLEAFRDGVGCKHKAELDCVTAQRDALRKAVDHYADKDNWCESQHEDNVELDITWYIGADNEGRKYGWTVAAEALMEKVHADFAALIDRKKMGKITLEEAKDADK